MWMFRLRKLFKAAGREALILFFAIGHPATPKALKVAAIAAIAYVISPIDVIPDIPLIGWLDDALILTVGIPYLVNRLPRSVFHAASERAQRVIEKFRFGATPSDTTR